MKTELDFFSALIRPKDKINKDANKILCGDCLNLLPTLEMESIDCCITSPPYWGLRDYGTAEWIGGDAGCDHIETTNEHKGERSDRNQEGYKKQYKGICKKCGAIRKDNQIGLEQTPDEYVAKMVAVFKEVKRVLKPEGTLWLNLGDSYNGSQKGSGGTGELSSKQNSNKGANFAMGGPVVKTDVVGLKPKDLVGIPWRVAFALQADGWYLRQDIIWHKPNPMPESVTDRCTKSHEYIFLLSKSSKYYFDIEAIKEKAAYDGRKDTIMKGSNKYKDQTMASGVHERWKLDDNGNKVRNKRSVWTVTIKGFADAHFATFPPDLIKPCVLAGCPEGGVVIDPFMGAGTTACVALENNRNYIGCELNKDYISMANRRIYETINPS